MIFDTCSRLENCSLQIRNFICIQIRENLDVHDNYILFINISGVGLYNFMTYHCVFVGNLILMKVKENISVILPP